MRKLQPSSHLFSIALVVSSTAMMATSDLSAKLLVETLPVVEVMWSRYFAICVLAGIALIVSRKRLDWRGIDHRLQLTRGFCVIISATLFIIGLIYLPVGEATGITFISPILVTVLSVVFLAEMVGWRRWLAVAVGFLGIVIIAEPDTAAFQPAVLLPLAAALLWAVALIVTRKMAASQNVSVTLLYTAAIGVCLTSAVTLTQFQMPTAREMMLMLLTGTSAAIGHTLLVLAYQRAPASQLAAFSYTQVLFANVLGYLVFGAVPGTLALCGIVLVILSGIYAGRRERAQAPTLAGPPGPT